MKFCYFFWMIKNFDRNMDVAFFLFSLTILIYLFLISIFIHTLIHQNLYLTRNLQFDALGTVSWDMSHMCTNSMWFTLDFKFFVAFPPFLSNLQILAAKWWYMFRERKFFGSFLDDLWRERLKLGRMNVKINTTVVRLEKKLLFALYCLHQFMCTRSF